MVGAPLKTLFFVAVLKLDMKDSFGYSKGIESMGKIFSLVQIGAKWFTHIFSVQKKYGCIVFLRVKKQMFWIHLNLNFWVRWKTFTVSMMIKSFKVTKKNLWTSINLHFNFSKLIHQLLVNYVTTNSRISKFGCFCS